jgi:nitrate/TMAO reductase-like tetraheme cytochrome c subunit
MKDHKDLSIAAKQRRAGRAISILFVAGLCLTALSFRVYGADPGPASPQSTAAAPTPVDMSAAGNDACMACHGNQDLSITLPSGEAVNLGVDAKQYEDSIHGHMGMFCTSCHRGITSFPHPPMTAKTRREFSLAIYPLCSECHKDTYRATLGSVHRVAQDAGNQDAAECVDCHGSHNIGPAAQSRSDIAQSCRKCHSEIYDLYKQSVHGKALLEHANPDVPSCIDCHGTHKIQGPSNAPFRLFSTQLCAKCHTDKTLMARYNINSNVLQTYVTDFHGTTVTMFQALEPNQRPDTPVCIDCHGVHDIREVTDANSTVIKQNLLTTCRKCHPNATANFPGAWLSHYIPSWQHDRLVYVVNVFYWIAIPLILGGMAVFVFFDYLRQIIDRIRRRRHA